MWMHNGNIGGWKHVKRSLALSIEAEWFNGVQGGTDSEWAFALFLDSMQKAGHDPSSSVQDGGFGHAVLREAMLQTIKRINQLIADVPHHLREDLDTRSLLNFAVADGHSVVCTRYVTSATDEAASLYFSSGTCWKEEGGKGNYKMERRDKGADIVLVASEPLTFERGMRHDDSQKPQPWNNPPPSPLWI
jgi:glutamine amidotransferase